MTSKYVQTALVLFCLPVATLAATRNVSVPGVHAVGLMTPMSLADKTEYILTLQALAPHITDPIKLAEVAFDLNLPPQSIGFRAIQATMDVAAGRPGTLAQVTENIRDLKGSVYVLNQLNTAERHYRESPYALVQLRELVDGTGFAHVYDASTDRTDDVPLLGNSHGDEHLRPHQTLVYSPFATDELDKLEPKDRRTYDAFIRTLQSIDQDPQYPSLRTRHLRNDHDIFVSDVGSLNMHIVWEYIPGPQRKISILAIVTEQAHSSDHFQQLMLKRAQHGRKSK